MTREEFSFEEADHYAIAKFSSLFATPIDENYEDSAAFYLQQGRRVLLTPEDDGPTAESVFVSRIGLRGSNARNLMVNAIGYAQRTIGKVPSPKDDITAAQLKKMDKPYERVKADHVVRVNHVFGGENHMVDLYSTACIRNLIKNKKIPPLPVHVEAMLTEKHVLTPLACKTALVAAFDQCQKEWKQKAQITLTKKKPAVHFLSNPKRMELVRDILELRDYFTLNAVDVDGIDEDEALKVMSRLMNQMGEAAWLTGADGSKPVLATANKELVKLSEMALDEAF